MSYKYAHMCSDGHQQIGHNSEHEQCPLCRLRDENYLLKVPFRNVDNTDWIWLFRSLPDSGSGKFWKSVMRELQTACERIKKER